MEPIKFSGKYSFDDFKKGIELNKEVPHWLEITRIIIDFVLLILFAIVSIFCIQAGIWIWIPLFILLFVVLFFKYWYTPRRMQKVFTQEKFYQVTFEVEITGEHLGFSNEISQSKRAWKDYARWRENRYSFLLYTSDASAQIIPKRFINHENDAKTIRRLLRENEVPMYQGPIWQALLFSALYLLLLFYVLHIIYSIC